MYFADTLGMFTVLNRKDSLEDQMFCVLISAGSENRDAALWISQNFFKMEVPVSFDNAKEELIEQLKRLVAISELRSCFDAAEWLLECIHLSLN